MQSFGWSDAAVSEVDPRKKDRVNPWIPQECSGAEAVCALGMLLWSPRCFCLENQPGLKEILEAWCESSK